MADSMTSTCWRGMVPNYFQNKLKSSPSTSWYMVCMKHGSVHCGQTSPLCLSKGHCTKSFAQMQPSNTKPYLHVLFRECSALPERIGFFFLATLPKKSCLSTLFLMVLSWAFTFNMLTEAWDVAPVVGWGVCNFTEHYLVWPWGEFTGIATPGTTVWTHIWMLQISKFPKLLFL